MSTDCTPRYCYADPYEGGKQAVAECYRNLSAVGATPLAITNCLNFASPQRPEIMAQLTGCLEGMGDACRALDFPIVSGNVSLYNESKATGGGNAILPTPAIGGVGLLADWSKSATIGFKAEGEAIIRLGAENGNLGQSLWLREIHGREDGSPPQVDLHNEKKIGSFVRDCIAKGSVTSVHDISDGGMLVAVAEMALAGRIGALVSRFHGESVTPALFAEDQGSYLVTVTGHFPDFIGFAEQAGVSADFVGHTLNEPVVAVMSGDEKHAVSLDALRRAHEGFFPALMGADAALA